MSATTDQPNAPPYRHRAQRLRRRSTPADTPAGQSTTAAAAPPLSTRGSNATPGDLRNSSYARIAHTLLAKIHEAGTTIPHILPATHYIVTYLSGMRHRTVVAMLQVMREFTLEQLNALRPPCTSADQDGIRAPAEPAWSADATQLIIKTINAYLDYTLGTGGKLPISNRKLLVFQFSHPGLDAIGIERLLNEPSILDAIDEHDREAVGRPLVVFKYADPLGLQWHNTRRYAHMSDAALACIRNNPCSCASIPDKYKRQGHLRTSDPGLLADPNIMPRPSANLRDLCAMGAKFRPGLESAVLEATTEDGIMSSLTASFTNFARKGEQRAARIGCLQEWKQKVLRRLRAIVDDIPADACISSVIPLSYTQSDESTMRQFLNDKVCTSMDKAASTIMFNCQKDYVTRCQDDLDASTVYEPVTRSQTDIVQESNDFGVRYGFSPDSRNQDIPYYKAIDKMHKVPHPGSRFISSSATSHLKRVSFLLNILFNALSLHIDELFGVRMASMGISAEWASRSWVLESTAQLIPLLEIWNSQYAQHTPTSPPLESCDFERLYTDIDTDNVERNITLLVSRIFDLDRHANHVVVKVWETKPAVWLKQNQVPADDQARSGSGHGGTFMIFDEDTISIWLSFLLSNMYVKFGDQIFRQIQGTPMGTNCASHLANFYLTSHELMFISRLARVYLDFSLACLHALVVQIARASLFTARYIDDLLSIINPFLHHLMYADQYYHHPRICGIYPRTLCVTTADSGDAVNYMDITIQRQPGSNSRLTTVLFDKREHQPLNDLFIIKFPHASSNISNTAKYGIM